MEWSIRVMQEWNVVQITANSWTNEFQEDQPVVFVISVIAFMENKENLFKGFKNSFCYRRISITGGYNIAGFNCMFNRFCLCFEVETLT